MLLSSVTKITMTRHYLPFLCLFLYNIISVSGHGNMVWPPVWQDAGGKWGLTPLGNFFIGRDIVFEYEGQLDFEKTGVISMWYTNYTLITIEPTIEDYMRTFPNIEPDTEEFIGSVDLLSLFTKVKCDSWT